MSLQQFIKEFNKIAIPAEGFKSMRYYQCDNGQRVEIEIFEDSDENCIYLDHILNPSENIRGNGAEALKAVTELADTFQISVVAPILPSKEGYENTKLKKWYKDSGFVEIKNNLFQYKPR